MSNSLFKHRIPIQIRFSDIDRLNHVNNACYLNFFELGRVNYFNQVLEGIINWSESGFVLARTEMDYIEPVFLNDEVVCYTRTQKLGNKSLLVENVIAKKLNGMEVIGAKGTGVLVAMNYKANQSMIIPDAWKKRISEFEGNNV